MYFCHVMNLKTRTRDGKKEILDTFRRKYVPLTPEEWVRQQFARQMVDTYGYPEGRIGIEISLKVNRMPMRTDIVVFDAEGQPWMVAECKAPSTRLGHKVFEQAARYNYQLRASYIVLTNGKSIVCLKPDYDTGEMAISAQMPAYPAGNEPFPNESLI